MDPKIVQKFKLRFHGNNQAYGSDTGGAVRQPVTNELIEAHLQGATGIGIYPIRHDGNGDPEVKWGCCDIDTGSWEEAYSLATALRGMGLKPLIERSRSKGWHIWVFASSWVPAATMRRALLVGYQAIDLVAKEANPKQEKLDPSQLGNYVRLPYKGISAGPIERQVFVAGWHRDGDGEPADFQQFMDADVSVPVEKLEFWANKYVVPTRKQIEYGPSDDVDVERVIANMNPDVQRLIRKGPKFDRSGGMTALAFKLKEGGATPAEALGVLAHVDITWGKSYTSRSNGDVYLNDLVERAYS